MIKDSGPRTQDSGLTTNDKSYISRAIFLLVER